jgi:hypothetical protein
MNAVTGSGPETAGLTGPVALCDPQLAPETWSARRSDEGTAPLQWTEHSS